MTKKTILLSTIITIFVISFPVSATDWPQWRGPFFNGSTDEKNLPDSWSRNEGIAWVSPLPGPSGATAIICNGRVFVSSTVKGSPDFVALCFDARNGKKLWENHVGSDTRRFTRNNMASPSAVTDGKYVFFLYGSGELVGFDFDGNKLWSRNIEQEYGNLALKFGYSSSPLLYQNKLFILAVRRDRPYRRPEADEPLDSYLMALDPKTGKTLWKQQRPTNAFDEGMETYSTSIPFVSDGRAEILNTGADFITAHDPDTGKELWRFEYHTSKVRDSRIISSLVTGDGLIFGTRHKHGGIFALQPPNPNNPSGRIVWEFDGPSPDASTPLYYQKRLYVLNGIRYGKVVTCLEPKTGRQIWQGKIGGRGPWRASLTGADGKLYCINETGEVVVLAAAGGNEFKVIFQTKINEGPIQSSISIADGRLFIRTAQNLYCIGK
jgi:outer membrane protein assembly factor BamB